MRRLAWGLTCLLLLGTSAGGRPAAAPGDEVRGMRLDVPLEIDRYRQKFALVIGINYDGPRADDDRRRIARLRNPESDAEAVRDLLLDAYGFEKDNVRLLRGKEATREAIVSLLSDDWLGKR